MGDDLTPHSPLRYGEGKQHVAAFALAVRPGLLRGLGGGLGGYGRADPDGLDVDELPDAPFAELAAITAALDAAEGQARVGGHHAVDKDGAGLDATGELAAALNVLRPQRRAQAEVGVVGQAHGVIRVGSA